MSLSTLIGATVNMAINRFATIICLIRGTIYRRFWFSYILFIIIIGGMLVLFIYITRLASNEIFSPSNKTLIIILPILPALLYIIPTLTNNKEINVHETIIENEIIITTTVIYNQKWELQQQY